MLWSDMGGHCRAAILFAPDRALDGGVLRRLGLLALRDALAVLAPPHVPVDLVGGETLLVDGGVAATVRSAQAEGAVPAWAVLGLDVAVCPERADPGETPELTSLAEEGFGAIGAGEVLQHTCRHLLGWIDAWQEEGVGVLAEAMGLSRVRAA